MAIVSLRSKKRLLEIVVSGSVCLFALLIQLSILSHLSIHGTICNLPLTLTIAWGLVFGSQTPSITAGELRSQTFGGIFFRQLSGGSFSGFLIGLFFTCLYGSIIPLYPVAFPLVGWIAGYFCLRGLSQGNLLCIPMVFVLSIIAEGLASWQLSFYSRAGIWEHLNSFILPEAMLNAIVAPFIYLPMRRWSDLSAGQQSPYTAEWSE